MFPVTIETTVSVSERAHLPSNMFSIPQAERCAAQLRKRPPTEQMAEPWNRGGCERLRKSLGWSSWQEQQEGAVGGIADKLHCTGISNKHAESGAAFLPYPSFLSPSVFLPFTLPSIYLSPFLPFFAIPLSSSTFLSLSFISLCPNFFLFSLPSLYPFFFPPLLFSAPPLPLPHPLCFYFSLSSSLSLSPLPSLCSPQLFPFVLSNGLPVRYHAHSSLSQMAGGWVPGTNC